MLTIIYSSSLGLLTLLKIASQQLLLLLLLLLSLLLLNSRMLISTNGYVLFLRYGVNKAPHISRTFPRILLACIKTVFCNSVIFVSIRIIFSLFSEALARVPRIRTTNEAIVTFIFHTFFSFLARSKLFSSFSASLSSTLVS